MIKRLINYFKKDRKCCLSGIIRIVVDLTLENSLSFRLDGDNMLVNWGDGEISEIQRITGQFIHQYKKTGTYSILIQGESITAIDISNSDCIQLDVTECGTLEYINCVGNRISKLEVSFCKFLYELHCDNNCLESLKLDGLDRLFYLGCSSNKLKLLSVQDCRNLVNLYCNKNNIESLNLKKCKKLVVLKVEENAFDEAALLDMIATLKYKFNHALGLVGVKRMLSGYTERVRISIAEKGWSEM